MKCVFVIKIPPSDKERAIPDDDLRRVHLYCKDLELEHYSWGHGTFEE